MKPGDFGIGSEQSRAAARMELEDRQVGMQRFELLVGHNDDSSPSAGPWTESRKDGTITRLIGFPDGMTLAEVARAVGGYSPEELDQFAEQFPRPLSGCDLYRLDR